MFFIKFSKFFLVFVVLLAGFLLVSASYAVDLESNSVDIITDDVSIIQQNVIGLDDVNVKAGNTGANNDISNLKEDNYKTFKDLNQTIANATEDVINLEYNYKYDSVNDSDFINGININKKITINGNGYIIDGSNMGHVFNIASNNVIIKNLNFVNCNSSGSGGAISGGVNCSIVDCSFVNCFASGYSGGAISVWDNSSVVNCSFTNCTSKGYGGAIFCGGANSSVVGCSFVNCSASSSGVISFATVNSSVINCNFVNCNSSYSGCSISFWEGNGSVVGCSFVNCSATGSGVISFSGNNSYVGNCSFVNSRSDNAKGGAISFWEGNGSVVGCSFVNCSTTGLSNSSFGGAIYWGGTYGSVVGCSFVNCSSNGSGGAIYWGGTYGSVVDCSFVNCSSNGSGGAIYSDQPGSYVGNCSFIGCNAIIGGAISLSGGKSSVVGCSFVGCNAIRCGAISLSSAINGSVGNCSFVNCSANNYASAIYFMGRGTIVDYCNFVNCSTKNDGGAIYMGRGTIVGYCSFVGCSAKNYGGAIYMLGGSVNYCSFVNCSSNDSGGVIYSDGDDGINVNGCIFTLCNAKEGKIIYDKSSNGINWDGNFFTTNNTITADEFIANGFGYKYGKGNIAPNYWVVLNIKFTVDGYVLEFVKNGTNNVVKMPDYKVKVILNDSSSIVSVGEEQFTKFYNESIEVYSLDGTFLASFYYYDDCFSNLAREISNCKDDKFVLTHNYKFYENYDDPVRDGIIIDKPIIIDGNGYIIDGFNKSSVFKITSNNVIIKNLNFVNCYFSNYSCVIDLGGVNCSVVNCSFVNSSGSGDSECGAIYCGGVNCSVVNCSFMNSYGRGGAIFWNGANGVVGNCSFVNSYGSGGAIFWNGANGVVGNCSFVNSSTNAGGAIYLSGVNGVVGNCSFVNSSANVGGAIYLSGVNGVVGNCSFVNCSAIGDGGGAIYWYPNVISGGVGNCSFVNCSANTYGGAIYSYGIKDIVGCSFVNCSANNEGGAIECIRGDSEVVNCSFVGCNASKNGGAISGIYRNVSACIFENNKASSLGNALCMYGGLNVEDNFFVTNNTFTSSDFIAKKFIYFFEDSKYVAPKKFVVLNIMLTDDGYVLEFVGNGTSNVIKMPDYKINVALGNGSSSIVSVGEEQTVDSGNIIVIKAYSLNNEFLANLTYARIPKDSFAMLAKEITDCKDGEFVLTHDYKYYKDMDADKDFINGIRIDKPIIINGNGHIINGSNVARAFKVMGSNVVFKNLTFTNCSTKNYGGAISWNGTNGFIINCSFVGCSAYDGGAIYWTGGDGVVGNCSFVGCNASYGGAIDLYMGDCNVSYCIFDNCTALNGTAIYNKDSTLTFDYNFFATNNISSEEFISKNLVYDCNKSAIAPNIWVVLNISNSSGYYVVSFVSNFGGNVRMPDYNASLTINNNTKQQITIKNDGFKDSFVEGDYLLTSLNTGNVLVNTTLGRHHVYEYKVVTFDCEYGGIATAVVTVSSDVTGNFTVAVDDSQVITEIIKKGCVAIPINGLSQGVHNLNIYYSGDENYCPFNTTATVTVSDSPKLDSFITVVDVSCKLNCPVDLVAHVVGDTGLVTFYVNDIELNSVKLVDGVAKLTYYTNATGNFTIRAVYSGSDLYNPSENTSTLFVNNSKFESSISVDSVAVTKGDSVNLVAHLDSDATGFVTFYVDNVEVGISKVVDGLAKYNYAPNKAGKYVIKAVYTGDDKYLSSSTTGDLTVKEISKLGTTLNASSLTITAYTSKNLVVTLKDSKGKVLSGKKLTITFNGKNYTVTTNTSGQAKLAITSKVVKNYTATIKFAGDNNYKASSKSVKIVIKPAYVTVNDIIKAAKTLKASSKKNKKLPSTIKVGSYKLTHAQLTYLMTVAIKYIKAGKKTSTKVKVINVKYTAYNAKISKKIMKKGYLSVVNTLYKKGVKGTLPKYFTYGGKNVGYNPYAYSLAKILAFYSSNKRLPNYCVFVNY